MKWKSKSKKGNTPYKVGLTKAELIQLKLTNEFDPDEILMDLQNDEPEPGYLFPM